jgi:predicted CXXCH cytochrome family protein
MTTYTKRFLTALVIALICACTTMALAPAQTPQPPIATQTALPPTDPTAVAKGLAYDNCVACHKDIQESWLLGNHGQAISDPIFSKAWEESGKPGVCLVCHATGYDPSTGATTANSITCEACHSPIAENHPSDNMPTDKSTDLCGKCHSDPRFGTDNWQLSAHYKRSMTCSVCHNPHSAGMKTVEGVDNSQDASDLCQNCHKDAMQNFPSSKHAEAGVTCVNCHLGFNVGSADTTVNFADAHKAPDHSFTPTLDTCNKCHSTQMHAPGQSVAAAAIKIEEAGGTPTPGPTPVQVSTLPVTNQPSPVSPVGYAGLAGLVGLAAGMVLAPWLERFYHRVSKQHKHEEERHE